MLSQTTSRIAIGAQERGSDMTDLRVTSRSASSAGTSRVPSSCRTRRTGCLSERRSGFTLVELLVVVTVLLILMVMTVAAIDFTFTSERVRSATRQVQSALEGARDRAIFAKETRGLRLLIEPGEDRNGNGILDPGEDYNGNGSLDVGNPRIVTSMIYVGGSKDWSEGRIRLERFDANGDGSIAAPESSEILIVRGSADCGWYTLKERGFLGVFEPGSGPGGVFVVATDDKNGNGVQDLDTPRIKIPSDENGQWHVVLTHLLTPTNQLLMLVPGYKGAGTSAENQVVAFLGTGPSTYILELPPRIVPDAQPILLPEGVCIDMDGSDVPPDWRPAPGTTVTAPYSSHMDILFSPRGVVTGPLAARGLVHLYLAERKDVVHAVDIGLEAGGSVIPRLPVNNVAGATAKVPDLNQFNQDEPIGQRKVISIFTQTGKVSSHEIDPTPKITPDGTAANPFHFATKGEAQSQ